MTTRDARRPLSGPRALSRGGVLDAVPGLNATLIARVRSHGTFTVPADANYAADLIKRRRAYDMYYRSVILISTSGVLILTGPIHVTDALSLMIQCFGIIHLPTRRFASRPSIPGFCHSRSWRTNGLSCIFCISWETLKKRHPSWDVRCSHRNRRCTRPLNRLASTPSPARRTVHLGPGRPRPGPVLAREALRQTRHRSATTSEDGPLEAGRRGPRVADCRSPKPAPSTEMRSTIHQDRWQRRRHRRPRLHCFGTYHSRCKVSRRPTYSSDPMAV